MRSLRLIQMRTNGCPVRKPQPGTSEETQRRRPTPGKTVRFGSEAMPRPHFAPGTVAVFNVKNRSGKKPIAAYVASRIGVVDAWAEGLVADGAVSLDGRVAQPGDCINLSAGPHIVEVRFPENWPRHMAATEMPLRFLHEDEHLIVLDKPPGIVVHPARGHLDNQTLQNGVRHRYRHLLAFAETTLGSPHRLDKDTSGVIVFSLTRAAYVNLVAQFTAGQPHKEYLAVVDGNPDFTETVCESPLGNDPDHKGRGAVVPVEEGGKRARTDFLVLEKGRGWALLLARPHTGRPHQIRIHAASLGLPLAGDKEYNPAPDRLGFARQALHACTLTFTHPATGKPVRVESPLAEDLRRRLDDLREGR